MESASTGPMAVFTFITVAVDAIIPEFWLAAGLADIVDWLAAAGAELPLEALGVVLLAQAASNRAGKASKAGAQLRYRIESLRSREGCGQ